MVDVASHWSARATRGPALTLLALASLASFGQGLLGRGDLGLSPPQDEPVVEIRAEAIPSPPAMEASLPARPAARRVAVRETRPNPAPAEAATAAEVPEVQAVAAAPVTPAAPPELAIAPAAADQGLPAAEVAPGPAAPADVDTPPT